MEKEQNEVLDSSTKESVNVPIASEKTETTEEHETHTIPKARFDEVISERNELRDEVNQWQSVFQGFQSDPVPLVRQLFGNSAAEALEAALHGNKSDTDDVLPTKQGKSKQAPQDIESTVQKIVAPQWEAIQRLNLEMEGERLSHQFENINWEKDKAEIAKVWKETNAGSLAAAMEILDSRRARAKAQELIKQQVAGASYAESGQRSLAQTSAKYRQAFEKYKQRGVYDEDAMHELLRMKLFSQEGQR